MLRTNVLVDDYYIWLMDIIDCEDYQTKDYNKVLEKLFNREFYDIVANDDNRISDGLNLRNRFADEVGEHIYYIAGQLPEYCTILEMMIALAIRIESDIMYDREYGDRTFVWFWTMMDTMGLTNYPDRYYDERDVCRIINRFLEREYLPNGKGGLFLVRNGQIDMRQVEIWYQMNYFLDEYCE